MIIFLKWSEEGLLRSHMVEGTRVDYSYWDLAGESDALLFAYKEKYDLIVCNYNFTLFDFYFLFRFFFLLSLELVIFPLISPFLL